MAPQHPHVPPAQPYPSEPRTAPGQSGPPQSETAPGWHAPDARSTPTNPWLVALGILSGLCIVIGIALLAGGTDTSPVLALLIPGLMLCNGGLIGLLLTCTVAALRWQPR